ncbi:MAG: type III secretion system export apparatus subunit SctU [Deltaproteobacteria bacterium]|nr:type III secretion system export apparatus subunit SctU [Deltaproteobacteria bacterium]
MADEGGEKTEEPTGKKLDDARKKGQVWKSRDLTGSLVFIVGFFVMAATFPLTYQHYREVLFEAFATVKLREIGVEEIAANVYHGLWLVVLLTIPPAMGGALIGALADFVQVGANFTLEPVFPKLEKLNPLEGLKNLFSKKQVVELLKSSAKLAITGYIAYGVVKGELRLIVTTARADPDLIMLAAGTIIYKLTTRVALIFILFSIFDVWWQHKSFMKDMMMTKDEVKREYKESEGDPHHKAKRKELHQEILEGAAMDAVADADVVVTNPDHYAVALKYDRERDEAPRIVAKGLDARAQTIKAIARQAGISEVRNVPLAHALYRVDVGQEIPEALYDAVAEVLNFVYQQAALGGQPPRDSKAPNA